MVPQLNRRPAAAKPRPARRTTPDEPRRPLRDLVRPPLRFHRSVHLPRDWANREAPGGYVVTGAIRETARQVLEELTAPDGARAWTLTGPYGSGKSSFLLFLADLLARRRPEHPEARRLRTDLFPKRAAPLTPLLLQAEAAPLIPAVAASLAAAGLPTIRRRALALARSAAPSGAKCAALLSEAAAESPGGLLLVLDELGKYLEFAAGENTEDIFFLQQLAEASARSDRPLLLIGALHSGFSDYLPGAGASARRRAEWQKVQGRFQDLPFALPDDQVLDLIAAALGRAPAEDAADDPYAARAAALAGTLHRRSRRPPAAPARVAACAPLHPTTALLLWPLFRSKAAQNERSLFAFLTSHEPYGFRRFLDEESVAPPAAATTPPPFFRLPRLYDYAVEALGSAAFTGPDARRFRLIAGALDRVPADAPPLAADLVKTIGLLTLYGDAVGLRPDRETLETALDDRPPKAVRAALAGLTRESIALWRRHRSAYGLWEGSDLDLDDSLAQALAEREPEPLHERLRRVSEPRPPVAREHSVRTGTLRWFEPRLTAPDALDEALAEPTAADGILLFVLGDLAPAEARAASARGTEAAGGGQALLGERPPGRPVVVAVARSPEALGKALDEVEAWQRVRERVPELAGDEAARREAAEREDAARRRFEEAAGPALGLSGHVLDPSHWRWYFTGAEATDSTGPRALQAHLTRLCDREYAEAPPLRNELLNRSVLSAAAAAGRRNLVERIVAGSAEERLGIRGFPPEYSMFCSLVEAGGFHGRQRDGAFRLRPPTSPAWKPVWRAVSEFVRQAAAAPRPLTDLLARLEAPPFGLRSGPFPVLLALYLRVFGDRVALYEDGLFVPDTGIETLERLIRRPETFEIRSLRFRPAERQVLRAVGRVFGIPESAPDDERLLAVTRRLVGGAVRLPAYARQTRRIGDDSRRVRDELLSARDPRDLILRDLPKALGLPAPTRGRTDGAEYAARLGTAVEEIGAAYPALLRRLEAELGRAVAAESGAGEAPAERAEAPADLPRRLREEAMRLREHATELTLRQFLEAALRTDDDRTDWREVLALPLGDGLPADRWNDDRAERAEARIRLLAHEMARLRRLVDSRAAGTVSSRTAAAEGNGASANRAENGAANGNGAARRLFEDWRGAMARYTPEEHQAALTLLTRLIEPAAGPPRPRPDA